MKERAVEIMDTMDAYSISKLTSYLLTMNDMDHHVLPVVQERMMQILRDGKVEDLELWDFKELTQYFSLTCNERDHFTHRVCDIKDRHHEQSRIVSDNELKSGVVLDALAPYIVNKTVNLEEVSLPFKVHDISEIVH